jgi:GAF domain-containing protein
VATDQAALAKAIGRLEEETSAPNVLRTTARTVVEVLDVAACTISRVIGDLLVDLVQHRRAGRPSRLGHGYLISDYPVTREVLERIEPRVVLVSDPNADREEVKLLREMDFDGLLMAALEVDGSVWGLVEVYADGGRMFDDDDVRVTTEIARAAAKRLAALEGRGKPKS